MNAIFLLIILLPLLLLAAGQAGLLRGAAPSLGVRDGKLKPPSKTPNSVSSQAALWPDYPQLSYAAIEPLRYSGDAAVAMQRLVNVLHKLPRTRVVIQEPDYIYAQCSTAWLHFTDDVEFLLDARASVIHLRSSSRLGRRDFGVNRARVEAIRTQFAAV